MSDDGFDVYALNETIAGLEAEIARHHADFERWEAMAAKGFGFIEENEALKAALGELFDDYMDAIAQGSRDEPFSKPFWHSFMSTYEMCDHVVERVAALIPDNPLVARVAEEARACREAERARMAARRAAPEIYEISRENFFREKPLTATQIAQLDG